MASLESSLRSELEAITGNKFTKGTGIEVLEDGDEIFPAMLEAIENADHNIRFLTYVYWEGEIAEQFAEALAAKAKSGVECHVLLDAFGSKQMHKEWLEMMSDAGVHVCRYNPFRWSRFFAYQHRTHRKILTCDEEIGFVGGVGIAKEWSGHAQDPDHWHDFHFRICGPIVSDLVEAFDENWIAARTEPPNHSAPDRYRDEAPEAEGEASYEALMLKSSPRRKKSEALSAYQLLFASAKKSIMITTAYLIPDRQMMRVLRQTVARGVEIEIVMPGRHNDSSLAQIRSRSSWSKLLKMGITLHIYEETMCHAKVVIIDGRWVSIGSINFDLLSLRLNEEANIIVDSEKFAAEMLEHFGKDRDRSRILTLERHRARGLRKKLAEMILRPLPLPWWKDSANY